MSGINSISRAEKFESMDAIALAKNLQWEIETTKDPAEASLKGSVAIADIIRLDDFRLRAGTMITVRALNAIIMEVQLADGQRASAYLDDMVVQGESAGIGFIQNIGKPKIQTLFIGLRSAMTLETTNEEDGFWVSELGRQVLVVPVLDVGGVAHTATG